MIIFDLETDGLLHEVSRIHCLALYDTTDDSTIVYNDIGTKEPIVRGVQRLEDEAVIVGHNIVGFDIPVLRKFYPWFSRKSGVVDTLILSRLYHADMMAVDKRRCVPNMPMNLYGRHSLEAYGYRLGEYKGQFGKTTDWKEWSQEMEDYMVQDVNVTKKLCDHFQKYLIG